MNKYKLKYNESIIEVTTKAYNKIKVHNVIIVDNCECEVVYKYKNTNLIKVRGLL